MHRKDGINVAVGGILVGISAVILGLLSPVAAGIVAGVCGALGLYMVVGGVYFGCPTPATAVERAFQPRLTDSRAHISRVVPDGVFVQISVLNVGRGDLIGAIANLVVPDTVRFLKRCDAQGNVSNRPEHTGSFWEEYEKFWVGHVSFPGRVEKVLFFRATMPVIQDFAVKLRVLSPDLEVVPWTAEFALSVEEFMPRAEPPHAPGKEPEQDGQGS